MILLQTWKEKLLDSTLQVVDGSTTDLPVEFGDALRSCIRHGDHLELSLLACAASMWCGGDPGTGMPVAIAALMLRAGITVHIQLPGFREHLEGFPVLLDNADPVCAILCGDGLLALAFEHLASSTGRRSHELITEAVEAVGSSGVLAGLSMEISVDSPPTLPDGRRSWEVTSGQISRFASRGGAYLAGATGTMLDDAAMIGLLIGRARFLVDGRWTPSMKGMKGKASIEAMTLAEQAEAIAGHGSEAALYTSIMYFSDLSGT